MATAQTLAPPMRTSAVQADIVKPANMQTLPSDPYNMLAQFGGLGYQPAAFDPTGNNAGYYGNATFIRSPLMQRYLQPTAMNTGAWVTNGLKNAMPGWNAVSNPGQNPYYTASQTPAQSAQPQVPQQSANPYVATQQAPQMPQTQGQSATGATATPSLDIDIPLAQSATSGYPNSSVSQEWLNRFLSAGRGVSSMRARDSTGKIGYTPEALAAQAAMPTLGQLAAQIYPNGINPYVLAFAKANPGSVQAQKMESLLGPDWAN